MLENKVSFTLSKTYFVWELLKQNIRKLASTKLTCRTGVIRDAVQQVIKLIKKSQVCDFCISLNSDFLNSAGLSHDLMWHLSA